MEESHTEDIEKGIISERAFFQNIISENTFGLHKNLLVYFLSDSYDVNLWINERIPSIEKIRDGLLPVDDWGSNEWSGKVCIRKNHVMIIDKSILKVGNKIISLKNSDGSNYLNSEYEWVIDTDFIEKNYTQYLKVSINQFLYVIYKWVEFLEKKKSLSSDLILNGEKQNQIEIINMVSDAHLIVTPNENTSFKNVFQSNIKIPATFENGKQWEIKHLCKACKNQVEFQNHYNSQTYIAGTELWIKRLNSREFIDSLGKLFGLTLYDETDVNNTFIYYYYDQGKSRLPAWFMYYRCKHCQAQYLLCYSISYGAERREVPDMAYLKAIYYVNFDEAFFLDSYNKQLSKNNF
jgi:hypothetical protein